MSNRPRLKSHAQPLRRGFGALQLGVCPDAGVVLEGLSEAEIAFAEGLDGSMDLATLYAACADSGVAAGRVTALIATLDAHHLLVGSANDRAPWSPIDEPRRRLLRPDAMAISAAYGLTGDGYDHLADRATRHVVVSADGDLPSALADLLRVGGIGLVSVGTTAVNSVDLELRGQPVGRSSRPPGSVSARSAHSDRLGAPDLSAVHQRPAGSDPTAQRQQPAQPDLVVLAAAGAIRPDAGEPWLRRGIPHLPVVTQGHRVQIGPLITGEDGPCLSCMDLNRCDRDAAWPALLSQLAPGWPLRPAPPVSLESTLTAMTIGAAAMIVHACLDGQPVPRDLSLELSLGWPTILRRRWFRHPMCACAAGRETMTV